MFQSLNLFKSINCPFYSAANNTLTCDRPHCQFKHPSLNSSSTLLSASTNVTNPTEVKQDISNLLSQSKSNEFNSKLFILNFQFYT